MWLPKIHNNSEAVQKKLNNSEAAPQKTERKHGCPKYKTKVRLSKTLNTSEATQNKTVNVRITEHTGVFGQPLLQWKSNKYDTF